MINQVIIDDANLVLVDMSRKLAERYSALISLSILYQDDITGLLVHYLSSSEAKLMKLSGNLIQIILKALKI